MTLLGMTLDNACEILKKAGFEYELIHYISIKPYKDADTERVVRVKRLNEKKYQIVYCNFKSYPSTYSQGK